MRRDFETEPKPFDIVPFEKTFKNIKEPVGHDQLRKDSMTGRGLLNFKVLSPVHISSGLWVLDGNKVIKECAHLEGKTVIPGSSLKGVFRTICETITPSCVCKTRNKRDLPNNKLQECKILSKRKEHCITCSIFGFMGYQGRIFFTDGILKNGKMGIHKIPPLYSPRINARLYKDRNGKLRGRKFYFHGKPATGREDIQVIEEGSTFESKLFFENVSGEELSLLFTSLGIIGGLVPKIGGAKPACLGSVQVTLKRLEIRKNSWELFKTFSALSKAYEGDELKSFINILQEKPNTHILNNSLARLKSIWEYPPVRNCPSKLY